MARVIWNRPGNPPRFVADELRIEHWRLGIAIHEIKTAANLGGADRVIIYDDVTVTGAHDGEYLGNVHDED